MNLNYLLLADFASITIDNKANVLGIIDTFYATMIPSFYIICNFESNTLEELHITVSILGESGDSFSQQVFEGTAQATADTRNLGVLVHCANITFPSYGEYFVTVKVGEIEVGRKKVNVTER